MASESCKKRRVKVKKKKYSCKYKQTWDKNHPFLRRSHKGDEYAKCNFCKIDISVAREGKNDVTKHVTSENHKMSIAAEKRNQRIISFMAKGPEESDKLIYAETKFAMLVMKNSLPFSSLKPI